MVQQHIACACAEHHNDTVRGLRSKRIECDEIWAFTYCKQKHVKAAKAAPEGAGDCWTWTAIDRDSKMIVSYYLGLRSWEDARQFLLDLAGRVVNIAQLTTDGFARYPDAAWEAFGNEIDLAQLIKSYSAEPTNEARYSPANCVGCRKVPVFGDPKKADVSTSIVERNNLTMRMSMRRFTRLTNGHSKKVENHGHTIALFFCYYNFCRIHSSLRVTPAMEAGLSDHVWSLEELIGLLD